jgi:hypothetical protein
MDKLKTYSTLSLVWVKGHYSGKKEVQHLMNEQAHDLAVAALRAPHKTFSEVSPPSSLVILRQGHVIMSHWQAILQEHAHAEPLRQTICKNNHWTEDQFDMVDWAALNSCLKHYSRSRLLSRCKLLHGLLNTNKQNKKFYKSPTQCPHCCHPSESFWHVMSCNNPAVVTYRSEQQKILWRMLERLHTPTRIIEYLKMGITGVTLHSETYSSSYSSTSATDHSSVQSSSVEEDICQSAFYQQSQCIGWENLLRGRVSKLWGEACFQTSLKRQQWVNQRQWSAKLIEGLLTYSNSLWKFRCSLLYGRSQDEQHQKLVHYLQTNITDAYTSFGKNPHIIHHSLRNIFHVPLEDRLKQDLDSMQCFLRSYNLAKQQQELSHAKQAKAAAQFFIPRSLPTIIATAHDCNQSTCSSCITFSLL